MTKRITLVTDEGNVVTIFSVDVEHVQMVVSPSDSDGEEETYQFTENEVAQLADIFSEANRYHEQVSLTERVERLERMMLP